MATIKSYTDIEQSKKLAEILPLESADMAYWKRSYRPKDYAIMAHHSKELQDGFEAKGMEYIPCFSLSALLRVIPKRIKDYNVLRIDIGEKDFSIWYDEVGNGVNTELPDITMECPIDACVAMIELLHEQKLL